MRKDGIKHYSDAFMAINWNKPIALFENYAKEVDAGKRLVWVAFYKEEFAGYCTLVWESSYQFFKDQKIPEIMDLNVLPDRRKKGVGSKLLDRAEKEASQKCSYVGIGVGLYAGDDGGYGAAQKLYVKRGYVPDGNGVTYNYEMVIPGKSYRFDDDLVLWLIKKL